MLVGNCEEGGAQLLAATSLTIAHSLLPQTPTEAWVFLKKYHVWQLLPAPSSNGASLGSRSGGGGVAGKAKLAEDEGFSESLGSHQSVRSLDQRKAREVILMGLSLTWRSNS